MAYVLGMWRLASDMGMAGAFVITGLFSHWQIWMAIGALLQLCAWILNRYGDFADFQMPRVLMFHQRPPRGAEISPRKIGSR
jgi:hypothetical protein